ncbi:fumarylacetoacetate hydrolase family protein [Streptomyces rishiriensis]|uniref:2-keto-4-pentenoate hydratase/2-oxohepta-3-ene-1,7-dioic acid hydratase in catechol pathway n=1 Tax=Streptomyces rishiriensis TaxID=68264 RepID=A0ABU0P2N4_STRRH|nr:fumarylacetoacetate hydrolase family protein [Streptomyces rishiriensis]MDQ0585641.1 2-keto-4-pentenoate hydratase/2-oxohepta-3-ene-1,7-dioic acid hydratase in catechol pathway [Streptomyces rishiriensis]
MLICRFADHGRRGYGRVEHDDDGDLVVPVRYDGPSRGWVDDVGGARPMGEVTLLPPAEPSKIACVALNYASHGTATVGAGRRPADPASCAVVLKPPSTVVGHGAAVCHPGADWELRHEAELAVVIGTACKSVPPERAAEVVAGYTCANDLTAYARRAPEEQNGHPPVWAKHFDSFTPLGPWLATDVDPADLRITCRVNDETRQDGSTGGLITPVGEVVAVVSRHMSLVPGDVILTGTPTGSGPLAVGDRVEVSIAGIGTLRNTVGATSDRPWAPDRTGNGGAGLSGFTNRPSGRSV